MRQVTGHCTFMKPGLDSHSPIDAHVAHMRLVSAQEAFFFGGVPPLQSPHDHLQLVVMKPGLASHSPAFAQLTHCSLLSPHPGSGGGWSLVAFAGFS